MNVLTKMALFAGVAGVALTSMPAMAKDLGEGYFAKERFQVRLRAIGVLADGDGFIEEAPTLETDVDDAYVPELDITYFFTENIAAELIAATAKHSIDAGPNSVGDTMILPPTITLQYHFTPDQKFSPYIGAGINYSYFYGEDEDTGFNNLKVDGGFGLAAQAGFDYWINENWGVNLDVKYIDLDVDVSVNDGALNANDVELNPWIVGAGVSYRF